MEREKVVNCLTDIENILIVRQDICPREELQYWIELQEGVADALALLKEQEAVVQCKDCNNRGTSDCPIEELCNGWIPPDDWFCADGERKE